MSAPPRLHTELRNRQRTPLRELLPLDAPLSLFLDPSNRCNFHCSFCPRSLPDYRNYVEKDAHLDFDLCTKIFDELRNWRRIKVLRLLATTKSSPHCTGTWPTVNKKTGLTNSELSIAQRGLQSRGEG